MDIQDKLNILEEKLNQLLYNYSHIKKERDMLIVKQSDLDKYIERLEQENSLLKQNKEVVKKRIENMLIKFEE